MKTVKTAGTSIESYFERFCMAEGEWQLTHGREIYESEHGVIGYRGKDSTGKKWRNHMSAEEIKELVGDNIWEQYFKFCAIRNPWEQTISAFEMMGRQHTLPKGKELWTYRLKHPLHNAEQCRFLHWLESKNNLANRSAYLIDGKIVVDDVIRFEALENELERICGKLGLPWEPELLPTFKKGIRRKTSTLSNLYRKPAQHLVEAAYQFEINHFGYRFDNY